MAGGTWPPLTSDSDILLEVFEQRVTTPPPHMWDGLFVSDM